jgi:N-acetylglutamate synthase-like GNAT family acetyltransferase
MSNHRWVRFDWNLSELPVPIPFPATYTIDSAPESDRDEMLRTVLKAYASDAIWQRQLSAILLRMTQRFDETLGLANNTYLVVRRRGGIVAVSGVARDHWTDQNLLTGICVVPDHQRKGIGRALLLASLHAVKAFGCETARVYTETNSLADRKIYPLFGSTRTSGVSYPGERLYTEIHG